MEIKQRAGHVVERSTTKPHHDYLLFTVGGEEGPETLDGRVERGRLYLANDEIAAAAQTHCVVHEINRGVHHSYRLGKYEGSTGPKAPVR